MAQAPNIDVIRGLRDGDREGRYAVVLLGRYPSEGPGEEAYTRFLDLALPRIEAAGARILWIGSVEDVIIGDPAEAWNVITVLEFPSRKAFADTVLSPEWAEVEELRMVAMDRNELLGCLPMVATFE